MIYFLSSLPRSGSTLLASLLNQRDDTYASPTSSLSDTMGAAATAWEQSLATKASGESETDVHLMLQGIADSKYAIRPEKYIFDKSRAWLHLNVLKTMRSVQGDIKIVATVRPFAECLASSVKIAAPDDVKDFCKNSSLVAHLVSSYKGLKAVYETDPDSVLIIEYDDLVNDVQGQMDRISAFIAAPKFDHDPASIPPSSEVDEVWKIEGLHDVRPVIGKQEYSSREILGDKIFDYYQGGEFWKSQPDQIRDKDALDIQLEASIRGDIETSETMINALRISRPDCNRVAFNAGWYSLKNGHLQEGHELLDRGRDEDVFGNKFDSRMPQWAGEKSTVLLNLEGGLGDQIHGYRYARNIAAKARRVIVSCSGELAPIFAEDFPVVQHEAATGVYHDHWVPSMSAVRSLGYEYADLDGSSYIQRTAQTIAGRVGVRWSGNPRFEHEQHRLFPAELMFDAVKGFDCVSLQRDEGADLKPDWMPQAEVSDWSATRKSISQCELVITSCTSVAHLAAAMGIETWIVVPVLPYYLWALPGGTSPYYDSAKVFRQITLGNWAEPFGIIKEKLKCYMHTLKMVA
jgi:hypothetical protein